MNRSQQKRAAKHERLRLKALRHMERGPIHELQSAPLGITQELIREGLAVVAKKYEQNGRSCQEVVLTDAGRVLLSAAPLTTSDDKASSSVAAAVAAMMRDALVQAEACMSIVEPRSDKAEYLRILGVVRTALSAAPARGPGEVE